MCIRDRLRSFPDSPTGIDFVNGNISNNSSAVGAWKDGVVGNSSGGQNAIIWDTQNGIQALPGTEGAIAGARDVSSNGEISVGVSSHEISQSAAYYWDNNGINRLNDNIEGFTLIQSVASSISPNGNYIGGEITATDALGTPNTFPVLWEGAERTLIILTDSSGSPISGRVNDVSGSGYAVGFYFDASFNSFGFIWNPEFTNGVRLFEDWLEEESPGANLPFNSINVDSIASGNGKLFFTVLSSIGEFALVEMVFDVGLGDVNQDGDVELGDVNQDGDVNFLDISPFIAVLSSGDFQAEADCNQNGFVNFLDISPFIGILSGS